MDKNSKFYKAIQVLYDVAKEYGDLPVTAIDDEAMTKIFYHCKEIADKESKFVSDLLLAFVNEKQREAKGQ